MTDIQTILDAFKKAEPLRTELVRYYDGDHRLSYATEKYQNTFAEIIRKMRDNLCPIVVDAPADRMEVINFAGDQEDVESAVAATAWAMWQRERMEITSNDVHKEALKTGYGYLIVWPDAESVVKFYVQDSRNCIVIEDEDSGEPLFAAKKWKTAEEKIRLTIYYPDRIEKWITRNKDNNVEIKDKHFIPYQSDTEQSTEENRYGVLPVFKFETLPVLTDVMPIQDALNKTLCDKLVSMEFAAYPQRWATGLEMPTDPITGEKSMPFKAGADKLWFTSDEKTKFGQFLHADLEQFLKVADSYRLEMARVSGTPLHFFSINISDAISGKALKTLESRFTKKVTRLCLNFGAVWAKVMKFALMIEGQSTGNLTTQWAPPETQDEVELLTSLEAKQRLSVPVEVLWEEMGYAKEDIAKFTAAKAKKEAEEAKQLANAAGSFQR